MDNSNELEKLVTDEITKIRIKNFDMASSEELDQLLYEAEIKILNFIEKKVS
jgi:hypothetical protein